VAVYRLSATAEADILQLLAYTQERFGEIMRQRYEALLVAALRDIAAAPGLQGSVARPELGADVRSYHLRHSRKHASTSLGLVRRPRHLLLYRLQRPDLIGVGRVLHDTMEIERHWPDRYGDE
jgi:toxin ParE1/3/4